MLPQPHAFERFGGTARALLPAHAGQGERQLHVRQDGLVRDEVVALEHETDAVVAERVPVPVRVVFGGDAVDDQITGVVMVKPADDVQERGLAGAGRSQDGREFVVAETDGHAIKGHLREIARGVGLGDAFELQHGYAFA